MNESIVVDSVDDVDNMMKALFVSQAIAYDWSIKEIRKELREGEFKMTNTEINILFNDIIDCGEKHNDVNKAITCAMKKTIIRGKQKNSGG